MLRWQEKFLPLRAPDAEAGAAAPSSGSGGAGSGGAGNGASPPGATSPDSAPSTPQPVEPSRVSGETGDDRPKANFDFAGLSLDYEDEVEVPVSAEPSTGKGPQEAQPHQEPGQAVKPPSEQTTAPSPAEPPVQAPPATQEQEVKPPQAGQGSGSPPASLQDTLRGLENPETAKAVKTWLSQNMYLLSEEEKTALDTDAVAAIPGLLSRVHFESAKNAMNLINSLVPQMVQDGVQRVLAGQTRANEAMTEFFAAWPGLNQRDHGPLVDQFARMYRSANPKASRQDAIKFVGAAIHAHLGLLPQQAAAPKQNGATPPRPQPFAPARPGARQPMSTVVEESPWAGLGQNFDDE